MWHRYFVWRYAYYAERSFSREPVNTYKEKRLELILRILIKMFTDSL